MKARFEHVVPSDTSSFKAFSYNMPEFDAPWHFHPEYELTYIAKSNGIRYVGNSVKNFDEGDLVLLGPDLPHCWKNTPLTNSSASAIVIQWNDTILGKDLFGKLEFADINKMLSIAPKGLKFSTGQSSAIKQELTALLNLTPFKKLLKLLEILHTLASNKDFTLLCEHGFGQNQSIEHSERINMIYQFLKYKYNEKITLRMISDHVKMTESNFSRFFSKTMKKSFFSFLNEYRLNIACKLLIETELHVKEVGYATGYDSLPFFYRQFKYYRNISPLQYRYQYLNLKLDKNL